MLFPERAKNRAINVRISLDTLDRFSTRLRSFNENAVYLASVSLSVIRWIVYRVRYFKA